MIPQNLIHYIETEIIPRYEHFDKAHNRSHVQTVIDESLALAKLYPQVDERRAYTIPKQPITTQGFAATAPRITLFREKS